MSLTLKQKERFLRNKKKIGNVVRGVVKKEKGIIFGARAVNQQVKPHLRVHTEDWDILVKDDPKKVAKLIERKLDKKFGGNVFEVKPAKHEGTHTIKNRITRKATADISKLKEKIKTIKRKGVRYANLEFQKKKIKESLANPEAKFRHNKDKFTRLRIKLNEKIKKKKKETN